MESEIKLKNTEKHSKLCIKMYTNKKKLYNKINPEHLL